MRWSRWSDRSGCCRGRWGGGRFRSVVKKIEEILSASGRRGGKRCRGNRFWKILCERLENGISKGRGRREGKGEEGSVVNGSGNCKRRRKKRRKGKRSEGRGRREGHEEEGEREGTKGGKERGRGKRKKEGKRKGKGKEDEEGERE